MTKLLTLFPAESHFMIDIETLATTRDAAVTEIGCVSMNEQYPAEFHSHCFDNIGKMNAGTVAWRIEHNLPWKKNDGITLSVSRVLIALTEYLLDCSGSLTPVIWCKGTDFDTAILTAQYGYYNFPIPWKYNSTRDMRTILSLFPQFKVPEEQKTHNALEDAKLQRAQLNKCLDQLFPSVQ